MYSSFMHRFLALTWIERWRQRLLLLQRIKGEGAELWNGK